MPLREVTLFEIDRDRVPASSPGAALSLSQAIATVLIPGLQGESYGRAWRLGRTHVLGDDENILWGKIGFEREGSASRYDPDLEDFVPIEGTIGSASYTYYALDIADGFLAAEEAPPDIYHASVRAGFNALMRELPDLGLSIDYVRVEPNFEEWLDEVDVVLRLHLTINRPNPTFPQGQEAIEHLMGYNAKRLELNMISDDDDSLALDGDGLVGLGNFAADLGRATATGRRDGERTNFDSASERESTKVDIPNEFVEEQRGRFLAEVLKRLRGR